MTLRDAGIDDIPYLLEIAAAEPNAPHWARQAYLDLLPHSRIRLAEAHAEILGFYVARRTFETEWELETIVVAPHNRRQGIANILISDLLSAPDMEIIHLEVRASNHAARALYEKHGFRATGTRPRYYSNPVEDGVLYSRP